MKTYEEALAWYAKLASQNTLIDFETVALTIHYIFEKDDLHRVEADLLIETELEVADVFGIELSEQAKIYNFFCIS